MFSDKSAIFPRDVIGHQILDFSKTWDRNAFFYNIDEPTTSLYIRFFLSADQSAKPFKNAIG
jgi:hypothetical protein